MKFEMSLSLRDYIRNGSETTETLLGEPGELVDAIERTYAFFANVLWSGDPDLRPTPAFLSLNAFMLWISGVRMAMTGHAAATYPLFRTALESACYAYAMVRDPSLDAIWLGRHSDEAAYKQCRKAFQSAVRDTAARLNVAQPNSGDMVLEVYEAAIDFGAHPNARSVLHHLNFGVDDDSGFQRLSLIGLHAADSFELQRSLMACLDYGLATAIVLARSLGNSSEAVERGLFALNETKERLTETLFETR